MLLLTDIDQLELAFSSSTQLLLKLVLGLIIFGVALDLRGQDFMALFKQPLAIVLGLLGQLLFLPALSFAFLYLAYFSIWLPCPALRWACCWWPLVQAAICPIFLRIWPKEIRPFR